MPVRKLVILFVPPLLFVGLSLAHDGRLILWGEERSFRGVHFGLTRDSRGTLVVGDPETQPLSAGTIEVHRTRTTRRVILPVATTQLSTVRYSAPAAALDTLRVTALLETLDPAIVEHLGLDGRLVSEAPGVSYVQRATTVRWDSIGWLSATACASIIIVVAFVRAQWRGGGREPRVLLHAAETPGR